MHAARLNLLHPYLLFLPKKPYIHIPTLPFSLQSRYRLKIFLETRTLKPTTSHDINTKAVTGTIYLGRLDPREPVATWVKTPSALRAHSPLSGPPPPLPATEAPLPQPNQTAMGTVLPAHGFASEA